MCRVLFVFMAVLLVSCGGNQTKGSKDKEESKRTFLELTLPNSLVDACRELKLSELADFQPFSCAYPGLLIDLADPADCPDEFIKQYNLKLDDNPVLIMVKCK